MVACLVGYEQATPHPRNCKVKDSIAIEIGDSR